MEREDEGEERREGRKIVDGEEREREEVKGEMGARWEERERETRGADEKRNKRVAERGEEVHTGREGGGEEVKGKLNGLEEKERSGRET